MGGKKSKLTWNRYRGRLAAEVRAVGGSASRRQVRWSAGQVCRAADLPIADPPSSYLATTTAASRLTFASLPLISRACTRTMYWPGASEVVSQKSSPARPS